MSTQRIGGTGEEIAVRFLEKLGYKILERNYRYQRAEIDVVCYDPTGTDNPSGHIVFVEVKTRSGTTFGRPEESVTKTKQQHIIHAARGYLFEHQNQGAACRFDVISILLEPGREPKVKHFKHAFTVD